MPTQGERPQKPFINPPELAAWWGIGKASAYRLVHAGKVPAIRVGDRYLIPVKGVDKLVEATIEASITQIVER